MMSGDNDDDEVIQSERLGSFFMDLAGILEPHGMNGCDES